MAATYDSSLTTSKDQVRFLIQDTTPSRALFQDDEILWVVKQEANVYMAAARLADTLAVKNGGIRSKVIGDLKIAYDPAFFHILSSSLKARGMTYQMPYAGGISIADKLRQQLDTDATTPSMVRRLDDNPAAPAPNVPSSNPLTSI